MKDGKHEFYVIQHRHVAESKWGSKEPIKPHKPTEWCNSNWDYFGKAINPWGKIEGKYQHLYFEVDADKDAVWQAVGCKGFFKKNLAMDTLLRLREADDKGEFDSINSYSQHEQSRRHEFRIIKLEITQKTEMVAEMLTPWSKK